MISLTVRFMCVRSTVFWSGYGMGIRAGRFDQRHAFATSRNVLPNLCFRDSETLLAADRSCCRSSMDCPRHGLLSCCWINLFTSSVVRAFLGSGSAFSECHFFHVRHRGLQILGAS